MTIQHHLSDELLLEYASGALAEGWSIAVASHLALCPSCRKRLSGIEAAAGSLLTSIECVEEDVETSWAAMKARLSKAEATAEAAPVRVPREKDASCRNRCVAISAATSPR